MTAQPMVKAEGVHKSYGAAHILRGIDLEVAPREVFCLVGPSGSGKSTFLRCINHLEREVGDNLVFMDGGVVVESGNPRDVLGDPQHDRTKAFLSKVL
nr:ATP-binding cassette domain-containing protein [Streptomyces xanthophaeus]